MGGVAITGLLLLLSCSPVLLHDVRAREKGMYR